MSRKTERIAIYARVSTIDKGQTTQNQIRQLREYCKRRKWSAVTIFEEKKGGALEEAERPVLASMMEQVRRRQHDVVLVWSFDRFARSLRQLINALDEMKALGVQFVSYHEQVDTTTPMGAAMFAIIGALAELERNLIQERSKAGYARALAEGKLCHRPRKVFDSFKMLKLFGRDQSLDRIAQELGISKATISRRLTEKIREIREKAGITKTEAGWWNMQRLPDSKFAPVAREYDLTIEELRRILMNGHRRR